MFEKYFESSWDELQKKFLTNFLFKKICEKIYFEILKIVLKKSLTTPSCFTCSNSNKWAAQLTFSEEKKNWCHINHHRSHHQHYFQDFRSNTQKRTLISPLIPFKIYCEDIRCWKNFKHNRELDTYSKRYIFSPMYYIG